MQKLFARRALSRLAAAVLATAGLVTSAACAAPQDVASAPRSAEAGGTFPLTITHALGTTEIPARPQRVVALSNADISLATALGADVVAAIRYPRSTDGNYPGVEPPLSADVLTLDQVQLDLEKVVVAEPDLILATGYYQIAQYYAQLSEIAPTLAYQTKLYGDSQETQALEIGRALGAEAQAQALLDTAEQALADFKAAHPALAGKRYIYGQLPADGSLQVYTAQGPTTQFFLDLGLVIPESLADLPSGGTRIPVGVSLSPEQVGYLDDADLAFLVSHSDDLWNSFITLPTVQNLAITKAGNIQQWSFDLATALISPNPANTKWILNGLEGHFA